jgi:hypothetical protein
MTSLATCLPSLPLALPPPPPAVRARLWLTATEVGETDAAPRLWLHLADGRVLAFRLPHVAKGDDRVLAPLAQAVRDDARGMLNGLELPGVGYVHILYAAPVLPVPQPERWRCIALTRGDLLMFAHGLDIEVLDFLGTLGGNDFYASARNYNRIAALAPEPRLRRLQALRRFPALVAPLLLTAHRGPNLFDGKRHAWRQPDAAVETAIHEGRDLAGALARHYGVSKGLVRAPLNAAPWDMGYELRRGCLALFDTLPPNKRPTCPDEVERYRAELQGYLYLFGGEGRSGQPLDPATHVAAFRLGWTRTWDVCRQRFAPLTHALVDARDFLAAAAAQAAVLLKTRRGPSQRRLTAAWLAAHGLTGLLAASARWHALRPNIEPGLEHYHLPALLGEWQDANGQARELLSATALAEEGAAMHHCIGDYWERCVSGERIFALRMANGERATAQYQPHDSGRDDVRYALVQLRGPANATASPRQRAFAERLVPLLNAVERASARCAARVARFTLERAMRPSNPSRPTAWLDETSEQQLRQALAALDLAPARPGVLLVADVAGYAYHAGPQLEGAFVVDQPLGLVREPDNPYDPLAVRLDWQGHKIGYVPRRDNAAIADALDHDQALSARIVAIAGRSGDPWQRLEFAIATLATVP